MTHHRTVIVGAGFSGLGMAIKLRQEGELDFAVLERASDIGGTWRDNTYPGCRCDVPSHLYSFSFAPNPNWSSTFSPQREILDYLRDCAKRYGVMPHIRFDPRAPSATRTRPSCPGSRNSRARPSTPPAGTTSIQPKVDMLHVFQRTAPWVVPHPTGR